MTYIHMRVNNSPTNLELETFDRVLEKKHRCFL